MSVWEELMALVGFGVDEEERVWMWTDDPSSVDWVVTVRQRWRGVETVETPRRHLGVELSWFETLEWTPGHPERVGWEFHSIQRLASRAGPHSRDRDRPW